MTERFPCVLEMVDGSEWVGRVHVIFVEHKKGWRAAGFTVDGLSLDGVRMVMHAKRLGERVKVRVDLKLGNDRITRYRFDAAVTRVTTGGVVTLSGAANAEKVE